MTPEDTPDAMAGLRWLRVLVTVLTLTMIAAGLVLIYLFVTRFPEASPQPATFLPDTIEIPAGASVTAVTRGSDWWAVVTRDAAGEAILIFGADGALRQRVPVTR